MAINKTINKRTNTHGAMRNCIEYVLRQDKTSELLTYVTSPYCRDEINYDLVYRTFLEEKKMWDKDSGRMYAHNIISWHKDEQITPEQALEFGKEFCLHGFIARSSAGIQRVDSLLWRCRGFIAGIRRIFVLSRVSQHHGRCPLPLGA